jgi:hypothetical protein
LDGVFQKLRTDFHLQKRLIYLGKTSSIYLMARDSIEMRMVEAFRKSVNQVPFETILAGERDSKGNPKTLNLARQAPGTIFRVAEIPLNTPDDQITRVSPSYRWYVTGPRDQYGVRVSSLSPQGEPGTDPTVSESPSLRGPKDLYLGRCYGTHPEEFDVGGIYEAMFSENAHLLGRPVRIDIMFGSGGEINPKAP